MFADDTVLTAPPTTASPGITLKVNVQERSPSLFHGKRRSPFVHAFEGYAKLNRTPLLFHILTIGHYADC